MNNKNINGFTLVELIVVMAIIAVLVTLSVLGISTVQRSSRDTQRIKTLEAVNLEIQAFFAANNRFPKNTELTVNSSGFTIGTGANAVTVSTQGITTAVLTQASDSDSTDYCYNAPTTGADYYIAVDLESNSQPKYFGNYTACAVGTSAGF